MKKKTLNSKPSNPHQQGDDNSEEFPGYPLYDPQEDMVKKGKRVPGSLDDENLSAGNGSARQAFGYGKRRKFRRARTAADNVRYQPGSVVDIVKSNPAMIAAFFYQRGYLFKSGTPQLSSGHYAL